MNTVTEFYCWVYYVILFFRHRLLLLDFHFPLIYTYLCYNK